MAYTSVNKSSSLMNTVRYTGTGSSQNITGVGFQPDMVWNKRRNGNSNYILNDAVRGSTYEVYPNLNDDESNQPSGMTAFISDGFTVDSNELNTSGWTYTTWNWKANGAGSSDTSGSAPTATVSANTTSGFSIVKYTTGSVGAGMTVPHGLGVEPDLIIFKKLNAAANPTMYHKDAGGYLYMQDNSAVSANTTWVTATSSLVTLTNTWELYNSASSTYVMYCFAEKSGYSKFGSFLGNGQADAPFIFTGFKPSLMFVKRIDTTANWRAYDNINSGYNGSSCIFHLNLLDQESCGDNMDFLSNGIKGRTSSGDQNASGGTYIYVAFGQTLVGTNSIPTTAR